MCNFDQQFKDRMLSKKGVWLLFLVSVVYTVSIQYCCHLIPFFDTDLCWLFKADLPELQRGFPNYYTLAYLLAGLMQYGLLSVSFLVLFIKYFGAEFRQNIMLSVVSVVFTLVLAEAGLRIIGYNPGQFSYSQWAHPVDSVYELKGFITDSNGITKVDTASVSTIRNLPISTLEESMDSLEKYFSPELLRLLADHWSDTASWQENDVLQAYPKYVRNTINNDGFYSIPFSHQDSARKKVLLLGDSFTWGHSTSHKSLSFANWLLQYGFDVYNSGISGTGVQQYELVLKNYFEQVKPDVAVLNFFIGNDVSYFHRKTGPDRPVLYHTNAGNIMSIHNGIEMENMKTAYDNVMKNMRIPQTDLTGQIMSKTVISTYLWRSLVNKGLIGHQFFIGKNFPQKPVTGVVLNRIQAFCDSVNTPLLISVIPELVDDQLKGASAFPTVFEGLDHYQAKLTPAHYKRSDGHFNDEGHEVYAMYLKSLLDSVLQSK